MVEIACIDGVQTFAHGMLSNEFARGVFAIIIDNHLIVYLQIASIIGKQAEGVDIVGWYVDVARDDKSYVTAGLTRNAHTWRHVCATQTCLVNISATRPTIVIPLGGKPEGVLPFA